MRRKKGKPVAVAEENTRDYPHYCANVENSLYLPVRAEIARMRDELKKHEDTQHKDEEEQYEDKEEWEVDDDIISLKRHRLFNDSNWIIGNEQKDLHDSYLNTPTDALSIIFPASRLTREKIVNDLVDSYIMGGVVEPVFRDEIIDAFISSYKSIEESNETILETKQHVIHAFYGAVENTMEVLADKDDICTQIKKKQDDIEKKIKNNNAAIATIEDEIEKYNQKMKPAPIELAPIEDDAEDVGQEDEFTYDGGETDRERRSFREIVSSSFEKIKNTFKLVWDRVRAILCDIFKTIAILFGWLKERVLSFAKYVKRESEQPLFWFVVAVTVANLCFFFFMFARLMFKETVHVATLLIMIYGVVFAISPLFFSKHIYKFIHGESGKEEKIEFWTFAAIMVLFAAGFVYIMCKYPNGVAAGDEMRQIAIAARAVFPFVTSLVIGIANYKHLKKEDGDALKL